MPTPLFRMSMTAEDASRTVGNCTIATFVGRRGAKRMVTSVIMPRVPSAPMKTENVSQLWEGGVGI